MITIEKGARTLTYAGKDGTVFTCAVALGAAPVGAKTREGDQKTPEGAYHVCGKNPGSRFHLALALSYPNARDARLALREGRISPLTCLRVCAADAMRVRPPQRTPLGGLIMIHGEHPDGKTGDWTAGCVALKNADMDALYALCKRGEKVIIRP